MSLTGCLLLSAGLFAIGCFGLLTRRNMIAMLLSTELLLNAVIINFIAFARFAPAEHDAAAGVVFPLFVIALTSCEMAIALALAISLHRRRRSLDVQKLGDLHG